MNFKKIADALYEGKIMLNNENDWANFSNRVGLTPDDCSDIKNQLLDKLPDESSTVVYVLGSEPVEGSLLNWTIKNLVISFKEAL